MIRRRVRPRPLALLPLVLLAGCAPSGGGGVDTGRFQGAEKDVAKTLDDLSEAARKRDAARVCAQLLSRRRVDALDRDSSCRTAMDDQLTSSDVFALDVDDIKVAVNRATAKVRSNFDGDKTLRTLAFVLEGGRWRLDSVGR